MVSKSPPPGSMPMSPDVSSMMQSGMAQKLAGNTGGGQPSAQQMQSMQQAMGGKAGVSGSQFQPQQTPRPLGTVQEEAQRAVTDVAEGIVNVPKEIVNDILTMLGLGRLPKTPDEQSQIQQFHQNWQRLDAEQQQVANMRIQEEMQRKEMIRQEDEMKAAQQKQAEQQDGLNMPGGKRTGQGALDKMQQDRKSMGGASG